MWNRNKAVEQIPLWILWMNVLREGYAIMVREGFSASKVLDYDT